MAEFNLHYFMNDLIAGVEQKYGADVGSRLIAEMFKDLGSNTAIEYQAQWMNKAVENLEWEAHWTELEYNSLLYNSGKSTGLYSVGQTSSVTTSAIDSTATELVSFNSAFGTEVVNVADVETVKLSTVGGASGSGSIGSFIVGEVLPAIGAVAGGVVLGVTVDKLLYESNPKYWDEKLPTLNPETWDDIILGHDTKIPILHNTTTGKTYMSEDYLAYTAMLGENEKWFNTAGEYDDKKDSASIFAGFTCGVSTSVNCKIFKINEEPINQTITIKDGFFTSLNNGTGEDDTIYVLHDYNKAARVNFTYGGVSLHGYVTANNWGDFFYDNKRANATDISTFSGGLTGYSEDETNYGTFYFTTIIPNTAVLPKCTYTISDNWTGKLAWLGLFGNIKEHHSDAPAGINVVGTVPQLQGVSNINTAKTKLREQYPNLYNNAINVPYVDNTGTQKNNSWLPVSIPSNYINDNPISDNLNQTDNGDYPDDNTKNKSNNDVVLPSVTPTTPINPTNPIDPVEPTPTPVIPVTPTDTGLGAVYVPTIGQLKQFSAWLWSSNFIDQILKLFSDPMQAIIGLHQVYFTPSHDGNDTIHTGYLDSNVSSDYTKTRYYTIDCGTINVSETFGNVFDYNPLTTLELYLPFIGIVPLNVGDVMRGKLNVVYYTDVLTGACLCNVNVIRDGAKCTLYTYGGNCAVNYPLSSGSYMGIVSALTGVALSVGTAVATGGASIPLSLGGVASSVLNAKTNVNTSGGYGGNTGAMGIKKPYLIIKQTLTSMANNYNKYLGNPYNNTVKLNSCNGFTQVSSVHLVGDMTQDERNEIETLLSSGIII